MYMCFLQADCPSLESTTTMTNNDIVINKLTSILSYLRQGGKRDRKRKRDKGKGGAQLGDGGKEDERYKAIDIYGGAVQDYATRPKVNERGGDRDQGRGGERERGTERFSKETSGMYLDLSWCSETSFWYDLNGR